MQNKWKIISYVGLFLCILLSLFFVNHNESFYQQTIAIVIKAEQIQNKETDVRNSVYNQRLLLQIANGEKKGRTLELDNQYTKTGAYDYQYKTGDKVFLSLKDISDQKLAGIITGIKRDQYMLLTVWFFLIFIILIGKKKGFLSALILVVNIIVFYYTLDLYRSGVNLLLLCCILAVAFTVCLMLIVSGNNKKTYAAIISTITGTFSSFLLAWTVMMLNHENGIRYEEMQFITRPIYPVFMSELLMGSLGAIMDISITMTSSIYELYDHNHAITKKALVTSGKEIGRDIIGTMCNVLLFAYVSGSIPMILLYIKNGMPVFNAFYYNLSMELVRALTGSIGIVLTIPISLYTSIFFLRGEIKD